MAIKLICIDMDGTLLNDNHEISEINKNAIKKAIEKGVHVSVTTGRLFTSAKYFSNLIGSKTAVISSNGAFVKEKDEDKIIFKAALNKNQLEQIKDVVQKYNLRAYFNLFNTVFSEFAIPENHTYRKMNKSLPKGEKIELLDNIKFEDIFKEHDGEILKAICIEDNKIEELNNAKIELKKIKEIEVVSSSHNNFEVMAKGASKGNAVKALAEELGIKREEIMCIGDSENDLSMIEYAGVGVAMGNGFELIKEKAKYITSTNNENGVAKAIEKFAL
ncbi:Cof-type HAD-IIB family hydrolase [Clostridium tarantellae]|uniref:Cof-type HAD-IIB family hydrolase n=1 Tax=Clostridium tarantellae TaxID=39493 RepID=A0A6I1MIK6_9CLOT|nr:Cof-type HAD-IIB family hydrolase [Clostridium tarantellae]MPQ43376.1 Cof-type HAD-IIB family hydrolase [Clostridium tarantellae]